MRQALLRGAVPQRARAIEGVIDHMAADGYNATTDFPACLIYKVRLFAPCLPRFCVPRAPLRPTSRIAPASRPQELLDRYPDAKVILSVRSTPEVQAVCSTPLLPSLPCKAHARPRAQSTCARAEQRQGASTF